MFGSSEAAGHGDDALALLPAEQRLDRAQVVLEPTDHLAAVTPEATHLSRDAAKALLAGILPDVADAALDTLAERGADLPLALRSAGAYLQETGASPEAYVNAVKERRLAHLARSAGDIERPDLDPLLVLGLSYDRLAETDPDLARSFTLLSVFPADFDAAGAAAVLDLKEGEALRRLALLHRRTLVQRPTEGRFRLHDLLRELAESRAADADGAAAANRHQTYYLTLLRWCEEEFLGRRQEVRRALATFETEQPNMDEALRRAKTTGDLEIADLGLRADLDLAGDADAILNLRQVRERAEIGALRNALARAAGNVSKAARLLGVSRVTLYDLLRSHGLRD